MRRLTNMGTRTPNGLAQFFLRETASNPPPDRCVLWPYYRNKLGYAQVLFDGKIQSASRAALILYTGEDPGDMDAAHGPCNIRHCINPHTDHGMRWKTRLENNRDKIRDMSACYGERNPNAKLTREQAEHICKLRGEYTQRQIAVMFSVSKTTVYKIQNGLKWRHINA